MKKLQFSIVIQAAVAQVWQAMLGPETYPIWTEPFCEGSYFEGSWQQGAAIRFLSPSGDGMTSMIAENRLHEFISIKHLGVIRAGVEDTTSAEVLSWAQGFENYTFVKGVDDATTTVLVELDMTEEYEQYMNDTWPQALAKLKAISEMKGDAIGEPVVSA